MGDDKVWHFCHEASIFHAFFLALEMAALHGNMIVCAAMHLEASSE